MKGNQLQARPGRRMQDTHVIVCVTMRHQRKVGAVSELREDGRDSEDAHYDSDCKNRFE